MSGLPTAEAESSKVTSLSFFRSQGSKVGVGPSFLVNRAREFPTEAVSFVVVSVFSIDSS